MQTEAASKSRPWYKEPYVWMLIGFPTSSVIVCSILLTFAVNTKDTLVRDNYYKDGLAINQELKWDKKAESLGLKVQFTIQDNEVSLSLLNSRQVAPTTLQLKLSHPTLKERDRDSFLQQTKKNTFKGFIDDMADGRFYVMVESIEQQWRIRKSLEIVQGTPQEL